MRFAEIFVQFEISSKTFFKFKKCQLLELVMDNLYTLVARKSLSIVMPELHALKSENWKGFNSLFGIKDKSRDILGKLTLLNQGLV